MPQARQRTSKPQNTDSNAGCSLHCKNIWRRIKSYLYCIFAPFRFLTDVGLFTAVLAVIAGLQWGTMEKTDKTLKASQRAWIEPQTIVIKSGLKEGENLHFTIVYRNIGKEPAINLVMQGGEKPKSFEIPENKIVTGYFEGENKWCKISHPNSNGLVTWPSQESKGIEVYTSNPADDIEGILASKRYLRFEGCFGYETVGEPRYSAFCFYTRPIAGVSADRWPIFNCMNHHFAR